MEVTCRFIQFDLENSIMGKGYSSKYLDLLNTKYRMKHVI